MKSPGFRPIIFFRCKLLSNVDFSCSDIVIKDKRCFTSFFYWLNELTIQSISFHLLIHFSFHGSAQTHDIFLSLKRKTYVIMCLFPPRNVHYYAGP